MSHGPAAVRGTPLGWLAVAATADGLTRVAITADEAAARDALRGATAEAAPSGEAWDALAAALDEGGAFPAWPRAVTGTAFQERVWAALAAIPPGEVRSYAALARTIGHPRAVRAVAGACAANPVALVVPCHRAVRRDGRPGGYRWGVTRKRALLAREGAVLPA